MEAKLTQTKFISLVNKPKIIPNIAGAIFALVPSETVGVNNTANIKIPKLMRKVRGKGLEILDQPQSINSEPSK